MTDHAWETAAKNSRQALALLGYPIGPACLPGEPQACGGSWAEHAMAHFAALEAVAAHQLAHLGCPGSQVAEIRASVAAELGSRCGLTIDG